MIRFQYLTPLKWPSRVRVQEEDYGFLPMTPFEPYRVPQPWLGNISKTTWLRERNRMSYCMFIFFLKVEVGNYIFQTLDRASRSQRTLRWDSFPQLPFPRSVMNFELLSQHQREILTFEHLQTHVNWANCICWWRPCDMIIGSRTTLGWDCFLQHGFWFCFWKRNNTAITFFVGQKGFYFPQKRLR